MRGNHFDMKQARAIIADVEMRDGYKSSIPLYELEDLRNFDRVAYNAKKYNSRRTYGH